MGYVGVGGLCRGGVGLAFFPIYIQPFMHDPKLEK